jgi:anti-sigma B factor antagonist
MYLVVRSIDFVGKTISLEVDRSITRAQFAHLNDFVGYCRYLSFSKIVIRHPADLEPSSLAMLRGLEEVSDVSILAFDPGADGGRSEPNRSCGIACMGRYHDSGSSVEYEFACGDMATALDNLTTAVLVIGYSIPLDEDSLSRLRLCLYELGANTVEHGGFDHIRPEIRASLVIGGDCIVAKYSDNAAEFSTLKDKSRNIAEKISHRARRGLGLFLLNSITDGLSYERDPSWNRTRFIIHRNKDASCHTNRRTDMNEITITVTPTDSHDTVVVTPAGSINSSTVPQLDACLNRLIQSGKTTIIVDLSETEFISSSGVGLLLGTVSALRDDGGDMLLMKLPKLVNDIFEVLNIKMHFRILEDLDELKVSAKP